MDELICHCFGHSRVDIERDALLNGRSLILEAILAARRTGGCHYAEKNPSGR